MVWYYSTLVPIPLMLKLVAALLCVVSAAAAPAVTTILYEWVTVEVCGNGFMVVGGSLWRGGW